MISQNTFLFQSSKGSKKRERLSFEEVRSCFKRFKSNYSHEQEQLANNQDQKIMITPTRSSLTLMDLPSSLSLFAQMMSENRTAVSTKSKGEPFRVEDQEKKLSRAKEENKEDMELKTPELKSILRNKRTSFPFGQTHEEESVLESTSKRTFQQNQNHNAFTVKKNQNVKFSFTKSQAAAQEILSSDLASTAKTLEFKNEGVVNEGEALKEENSQQNDQKSQNSLNEETSQETSTIALRLQTLFNIEALNAFQRECLPLIWNSDQNTLVSAPNGSGKTTLFKFLVAKEVFRLQQQSSKNFKAIYISQRMLPSSAFLEWESAFGQLGLNSFQIYQESDCENHQMLRSAHVILITIDKLYNIIRKWLYSHNALTKTLVFFIDGLDTILTGKKGAFLESIISHLQIFTKSKGVCKFSTRIIGISNTPCNFSEIAEWLNVPVKLRKIFGNEVRIVPLRKYVFGYNVPRHAFQFEGSLNVQLIEIIRKFAGGGKPVIIFCQTQKGVMNACEQVMIDMRPGEFVSEENKMLETEWSSILDKNLLEFLRHGVGVYNAEMCWEDKKHVERLMKKGAVQVLFTTNSQLTGSDLQAKLVIIQSTLTFRGKGGGYKECPAFEMIQMMGRAGRLGIDSEGIVVIMTGKGEVETSQKEIPEENCVESQLKERLSEIINIEIASKTFEDVKMIEEFIKGTYFGVFEGKKTKESLENMQKTLLQELHRYGMVQYDVEEGSLKSLELGVEVARTSVFFGTIKCLVDNSTKQDLKGLIQTLSLAGEFSKFSCGDEEKKLLDELNGKVKFPLSGKFGRANKKPFVLIQCLIGNIDVENAKLKEEMKTIEKTSLKILECFQKYFTIKKFGQGFVNCLLLTKLILMRAWEDDKALVLRQLYGVGEEIASLLCNAGIDSIQKIKERDEEELETVCEQIPPFGYQVKRRAQQIPDLELSQWSVDVKSVGFQMKLRSEDPKSLVNMLDSKSGFYLVVYDKSWRLQFWKHLAMMKEFADGVAISLEGVSVQLCPVYVQLISEKYVGMDQKYLITAKGAWQIVEKELILLDAKYPTSSVQEEKEKDKEYYLTPLKKSSEGNLKAKLERESSAVRKIVNLENATSSSIQREKKEDMSGEISDEEKENQKTMPKQSKRSLEVKETVKKDLATVSRDLRTFAEKNFEGKNMKKEKKPQQQFSNLFGNIFD